MTPLDDDLLTALRAARPDPGYQPSSASPEATALLARILHSRQDHGARDHVPRVTRRLLLAGLPAMAGAAAAAALATSASSPGTGGTHPAVRSVRTAVLDALERDRGDIISTTRTIQRPKGPLITQQTWTYPAFPLPGQHVRFRLFQLRDGVPVQDTESSYIQDTSSGLTQPTTQGPSTAEIIDVEYGSRTWSRQQSSSVLLAGNLSPSLIRDQLASGGFTVVGPVSLPGHEAVELTWSQSPGRMTLATTLWVDARTYLPLRSVTTMRAGLHDALLQTDTTLYQILPVTPANLDLLNPPIPAGFTRTAQSPHF